MFGFPAENSVMMLPLSAVETWLKMGTSRVHSVEFTGGVRTNSLMIHLAEKKAPKYYVYREDSDVVHDYHTRMCYKRFGSIEKKIQGDLRSKVDKGVISDDFCDWKCNCPKDVKRNGECIWPGARCRAKCVIYKYTCVVCQSEYVGSTQQFAKKRLGQHCGDVRRLTYKGEKATSSPNISASIG